MSAAGSITHWLIQLKGGTADAARPLWERYYRRLVGLARKRLRGSPRRAADEEDVALSAFDSFCRGVKRGRFPSLHDRDDLWSLLFLITVRKAVDLKVHDQREKRAGAVLFSDLSPEGSSALAIERVVAMEPTPDFAVQVAEECGRLLKMLPADLRPLAIWKMEGYTNEEIAARLQCVRRTVERKLRVIRSLWSPEVQQ